jgi:hypothetical protein
MKTLGEVEIIYEKKAIGFVVGTLLIITASLPIVGTLPSRTKTTAILPESPHRLIFCGLCTGPGLIGWGVNGYSCGWEYCMV